MIIYLNLVKELFNSDGVAASSFEQLIFLCVTVFVGGWAPANASCILDDDAVRFKY